MNGPPWTPGKTALLIALICSLVQTIRPPRGPRSVLCVVMVATSACGTGLGCTLAATRPAMCAMSTMKRAPTSAAIAASPSKSIRRG